MEEKSISSSGHSIFVTEDRSVSTECCPQTSLESVKTSFIDYESVNCD